MRLVTAALVMAVISPLAAQQPAGTAAARRGQCIFRIDYYNRLRQLISGPDTNYHVGGGVIFSCVDSTVTMASDSLAWTGPRGRKTAQFIGRVHYTDSTVTMDAERGTYFLQGEKWEARGNVHTVNTRNGSTLDGPSLDYYREIRGSRDTVELFATGRPRITFAGRDSTGQPGEPYHIIADRVRMKGNDRVWGGGKVTVDRSDFHADSDSMWLDNQRGAGSLIGHPAMRGLGRDSFELTGRRIDLTLERQALSYILAPGQGHAATRDVDLVGDTIGLDINDGRLVQTLAWGDSTRARALAGDYEIRADSAAFDTPNRLLTEVRAFGKAWLAAAGQVKDGDRDWLSGDTVVATFTTWDSAGTARSAVDRIDAVGQARSYYRVEQEGATGRPSLNYSRGDRIQVMMRHGARRGVERVNLHGKVDGIYLEPLARIDTTAASDTLRGRRRP
jgi:hypothetical protein